MDMMIWVLRLSGKHGLVISSTLVLNSLKSGNLRDTKSLLSNVKPYISLFV